MVFPTRRHAFLATTLLAVSVACGSSVPDAADAAVTDCGPTAARCSGRCVDPMVDPGNCGACDVACGTGQVCRLGRCVLGCFGGATRCDLSCVDLLSDPANCGTCGKVCSAGAICEKGACIDQCTAKGTKCNGYCVDVATDPFNCGSCGVKCGAKQKCENGSCVCASVVCDGLCTDVQTNPHHCGGCGIGCVPDVEVCVASKCTCASGLSACANGCVDLGTSSKHCGTCGHACAGGELCTDGVCVLPTTEWPTLGANDSRTGVVSGEIGKPPLRPAWSTKLSSAGTAQPVVIAKNHVLATSENWFDATNRIASLDLANGGVQWSYLVGPVARTGYPSHDGDRFFVVNSGGNGTSPRALAFDEASGSIVWSTDVLAQAAQYWAPLVVGGRLYTNAGTFGGLVGMDSGLGTELFANTSLEQSDRWSATWSGNAVLTFIAGKLRAHDPISGSVTWTASVPWQLYYGAMSTYPVVANGRAFVLANPALHAIDLATHSIVWSVSNNYSGSPAVYGGSVFANGGGNLIVRDAATGQFQWMFAGDNQLEITPVIANGYVYVSSMKNTYAVDIATHKQAWTVDIGGHLSIASRRLIIASDKTIYAFGMSK